MRVKELRDLLDRYDDETEVVVEHHTNNYWGHIKALKVTGVYDSVLYYSNYLRAFQIEDNTDIENERKEYFVILEV